MGVCHSESKGLVFPVTNRNYVKMNGYGQQIAVVEPMSRFVIKVGGKEMGCFFKDHPEYELRIVAVCVRKEHAGEPEPKGEGSVVQFEGLQR